MIKIQETLFKLFYIPRSFKRMISFVADFILLGLSFSASFGVLNLPLPDARTWLIISVTALLTQLLLVLTGFYSSVTRYLHVKSLLVLVLAALFAQLIFKVTTLWVGIKSDVPLYSSFWLSEMVVTSMTICVLLGGIRIFVLSYFSHYINRQKESVIIYGAGDSGHQLALSLLNGGQYFPVAFIDDDMKKQGMTIHGIKVWSFEGINLLVERYDIDLVMIALPSISKTRRQRILTKLADYSLAVKSVPTLDGLLHGRSQLSDLQEIQVDELLGRDPVIPQQNLLTKNIENKTVMITGAGGSIGSELTRQIANLDVKKIVLFESSEFALYQISEELKTLAPFLKVLPILGSVQDSALLNKVMSLHKVQTVFHAAAYKHVPIVESNSISGVLNNVKGTYFSALAAAKNKVEKFVLISTDKAVRPTNMMGASKRFAELILQALDEQYSNTCFTMVRFGNVLGSSGSVVPLFKKQISSGGPVTVTHKEIIRYFMTIPEAAQLVIQAGALGEGGDVFLLDMGEPIKIDQLARRMIYLMGYKIKNEQSKFSRKKTENKKSDSEIEIVYSGLRPGEKLYEELLVGDDAQETLHPRIMKSQENKLTWEELEPIMNDVFNACNQFDYEALRELFLQAPLDFKPSHDVSDLLSNN